LNRPPLNHRFCANGENLSSAVIEGDFSLWAQDAVEPGERVWQIGKEKIGEAAQHVVE